MSDSRSGRDGGRRTRRPDLPGRRSGGRDPGGSLRQAASDPVITAATPRRPSGAVGCYRDLAGVQRNVVVRELAGGRWRIYDVPEPGERTLVEELSGDGESRGSAVALDYLRQPGGSR